MVLPIATGGEYATVPENVPPHQPADLASALHAARRGGPPVPPIGGWCSLAQGYGVQDDVFKKLGHPIAGFKLAATSDGARAAMGLDEPLVGQLSACDITTNAAIRPTHQPMYAEAELVFLIGSDMPLVTSPPARSTLIAGIAGIFAGIEICSSRFADDELAVGALVADNCLLHALVLGDRLHDGWDEAFADCDVVLDCAGQAAVHGSTSAVMGHPLAALGWLVAWLGQRGRTLQAGQYVASGSATGITPLVGRPTITAMFGPHRLAQAIFEQP